MFGKWVHFRELCLLVRKTKMRKKRIQLHAAWRPQLGREAQALWNLSWLLWQWAAPREDASVSLTASFFPSGVQRARRPSYTAGSDDQHPHRSGVSTLPAEVAAADADPAESPSDLLEHTGSRTFCRIGRLEGWGQEEHVTREGHILLEWDPTSTPILKKKDSKSS